MGPTATGKTSLAIELAKHAPVDLISVDSAMVYKHMDIGTAKPSAEVLAEFPHALVDIRQPEEDYSVREFFDDANVAVKKALESEKIPVLVGGSMMYFNAFKFGLTDLPGKNDEIREELRQEKLEFGLDHMYAKLQEIDPIAAQNIHPKNWIRIERALEVFSLTNEPISSLWQKRPKITAEQRHDCRLDEYAVTEYSRNLLHDRIARRLEQMFEDGLWDEVCALRQRPNLKASSLAMQGVGYKQIWEAIDERDETSEAQKSNVQEKILFATRQLARRQLIWLRSWKSIPDSNRLSLQTTAENILATL